MLIRELQGRYLPIFASVIYDQNAILEEKGLTPINLKSIAIGGFGICYWIDVVWLRIIIPGNGVTDFFAYVCVLSKGRM